jgi:hypothetical protein
VGRALRWWSLLLVPGGFVAGHELGYAGASALGSQPFTAGNHGYLLTVLLVGAPFAFAAAARHLLAALHDEFPPVRFRTLVAAQVSVFAVVEMLEHARAGLSLYETATEAAVLLGLAAQVAVAAAVTGILHRSGRAAVAFVARRRRRAPLPARRPVRQPRPRVAVRALVAVSSLSRRGPPLASVA